MNQATHTEPQHCTREHAARLWERLEQHLFSNLDTITIAEAVMIYKAQDDCQLVMAQLPRRV